MGDNAKIIFFLALGINCITAQDFDWEAINSGLYFTSTIIKQYPYHVSLIRGNDQFLCNGAIIHPYFVLTTATCVQKLQRPKNCEQDCLLPYVRSASSNYTTGGQLHSIRVTSMHHDFNKTSLDHDIGLVGVREPFAYFGFTLVLPSEDAFIEADSNAVFTAWTKQQGKKSPIFQRFIVQLWSHKKCEKRMGPITNNMFCSQAEAKRCIDDMGAPVVTKGNLLVGIMIKSVFPCLPENPRLYIKVAPYTEGIRRTIFKYMPNKPHDKEEDPKDDEDDEHDEDFDDDDDDDDLKRIE